MTVCVLPSKDSLANFMVLRTWYSCLLYLSKMLYLVTCWSKERNVSQTKHSSYRSRAIKMRERSTQYKSLSKKTSIHLKDAVTEATKLAFKSKLKDSLLQMKLDWTSEIVSILTLRFRTLRITNSRLAIEYSLTKLDIKWPSMHMPWLWLRLFVFWTETTFAYITRPSQLLSRLNRSVQGPNVPCSPAKRTSSLNASWCATRTKPSVLVSKSPNQKRLPLRLRS